MKLTARIDYDLRCLESYFRKLFILLQEAQAEDKEAPIEAYDSNADESQVTYHGFSHLIKPGMVIDIYNLVDFWLSEICEWHKKEHSLNLGSGDIKGKNELHARHKYLVRYVGLNLESIQVSYKQLNHIREVRNKYVHGGGHVNIDPEGKFSKIEGIYLSGSLIVIKESFVWSSLMHAKEYLLVAARAEQA